MDRSINKVRSKMDINKAEFDTPTNTDFCIECHSKEIIYVPEKGEFVCGSCGLVLSHHNIDRERQGRRAFSSEEKSKRDQTGSPVTALLPDLSLTTVIDKNGHLTPRMKRIIKWNSRMSWDNRNMLIAATEIKRVGTLMNLPRRVKEYAAKIYKKAFALKLLRGRSIRGMVAASLYYSCRSEKVPRTLQEVLQHADCEARDVRRCYRTLVRELKLKVPNLDPVILVPKYASALDFSNKAEKVAMKITKFYKKVYATSGKDPKGIIAAALYLSSIINKMDCSQRKIARTVKVTEVTLRSRYKEMRKFVKFKE